MYRIRFAHFDSRGNQREKTIEAKTLDGIISKFRKEKQTKDFYMVLSVSPNLRNVSLDNNTLDMYKLNKEVSKILNKI